MQKAKKIYRKYEDFYTAEDLRDPDTLQRINLTIADFNAQGRVANPRAPCIVTTIDPNYTQAASQQRLSKKFRMKTDILQLREITRKKFMIYSTQQRYLEKQREAEYQTKEFNRIMEFYEFAEESLKKMESEAFADMLKANEDLKRLQEVKVADELKSQMVEHQRALMQVQDIYRRFLFLLKLICYFDDSSEVDEDSNGNGNGEAKSSLQRPPEITELNISDKHPAGSEEIEQLKTYMTKVVRPYLAKRNDLNADIWIKGYEKNRHKISNYNKRFTRVALLNHIVSIVYEKFQKTYARRIITPVFLRDPNFMKERVASLKQRTTQILDKFEGKQKQDKLNLKLNGIIPVILDSVEMVIMTKSSEDIEKQNQKKKKTAKSAVQTKPDSASSACYKVEQEETTLSKIEKIQLHLLNVLGQFDAMPPEVVKTVEKRVRNRVRMEKEMSRRALVKQNRLHNWMEHFKKHDSQKPK